MKRVSNATHVQKQNKQWAACPSSFMHTKTSLVSECPRFLLSLSMPPLRGHRVRRPRPEPTAARAHNLARRRRARAEGRSFFTAPNGRA